MADSAEGHPRLDWSTAEVSGGELVIELKGELPKGWPKSFDATTPTRVAANDPIRNS